MLYLIGTGVSFDLTVKTMEVLSSCTDIYIERYTNLIEDEKLAALSKSLGKKIKLLERAQVESSFLVREAQSKKVALLASGDPLGATTHISLLLEAKTKGVPYFVIHNSSIITAAQGKSGLQPYRFGKTSSLVNPRENYKPTSALEIIRINQSIGAHSLVLLDTEPHFMHAHVALEMLKEFKTAVVLSRVGELDEKITYGIISHLLGHDLGKTPFCIIIPAKLHVVEEEYLEFFKIK